MDVGRLALRPVQAVAHAGKGVLADETVRAIDSVLAGPLPEAVGRSLVEHHVVERLVAKVLEEKAAQSGASPVSRELADGITTSPAFKRALRNVLASPDVRHALERQTVGFGPQTSRPQRGDEPSRPTTGPKERCDAGCTALAPFPFRLCTPA